MCDLTNKSAQPLTANTEQLLHPPLKCEHNIQWPRIDPLNHDGPPLYSPTSGYFPLLYPMHLSALHYTDLLQHLSLESELKCRIPISHPIYNSKNLHNVQAKKNERNRNTERRYQSNNCSCTNYYNDNYNVHCSHCLTKCSCCVCRVQKCQSCLENNIATCRYCQPSDSCPSFHTKTKLTVNQGRCQHPKLTCHSVSQTSYIHQNNTVVDIPERETAVKTSPKVLRLSSGTTLSTANEDQSSGKVYQSSYTCKEQPEDKCYENNGLYNVNAKVLSYCGGTGDENISEAPADIKEDYHKKTLMKSTAYFLPISSLTKTK